MRILVTAGPTREALDPVRFISNRSSGKMGYAVAAAARDRGHTVRLISGPVCLPPPPGLEVVRVVSAADMLEAVVQHVETCEVLVMAAAVADWRPRVVSAQKLKKHLSGRSQVLELVRTPDILATIGSLKGSRVFVGFAAETENLEAEARRKLAAKGLDLIVANDVSRLDAGFEVDTNAVTLFTAAENAVCLPLQPKAAVAEAIVDWIERYAAARPTCLS